MAHTISLPGQCIPLEENDKRLSVTTDSPKRSRYTTATPSFTQHTTKHHLIGVTAAIPLLCLSPTLPPFKWRFCFDARLLPLFYRRQRDAGRKLYSTLAQFLSAFDLLELCILAQQVRNYSSKRLSFIVFCITMLL